MITNVSLIMGNYHWLITFSLKKSSENPLIDDLGLSSSCGAVTWGMISWIPKNNNIYVCMLVCITFKKFWACIPEVIFDYICLWCRDVWLNIHLLPFLLQDMVFDLNYFFWCDPMHKVRRWSIQATIKIGTGGRSKSCFVGQNSTSDKVNFGLHKGITIITVSSSTWS